MNVIKFIGTLVFNQSAKGHNYASVANGRLMGYTLTNEQKDALKALRLESGTNKAGRKMAKFGLVKLNLVQVDEMVDVDSEGRDILTPVYAIEGIPTRAEDPSNDLFA